MLGYINVIVCFLTAKFSVKLNCPLSLQSLKCKTASDLFDFVPFEKFDLPPVLFSDVRRVHSRQS